MSMEIIPNLKKKSKLETLVAPGISDRSYSLCLILPFRKEGLVNWGVASQGPLQMFSLPDYLVPVIPEGGDSSEDCDCVSHISPCFPSSEDVGESH